jgi:hypothetical protein
MFFMQLLLPTWQDFNGRHIETAIGGRRAKPSKFDGLKLAKNGGSNYDEQMRRLWKKIILVIAIIGSLPVLYLAEEHYRGLYLLHSRLAELRANHEPLSVAELVPKPVPEDQNAASALLHLTNQLDEAKALSKQSPNILFIGPGRSLPPWKCDQWEGDGQTNTWGDVEEELSAKEPLIAAIRAAIDKPGFDTGIET